MRTPSCEYLYDLILSLKVPKNQKRYALMILQNEIERNNARQRISNIKAAMKREEEKKKDDE